MQVPGEEGPDGEEDASRDGWAGVQQPGGLLLLTSPPGGGGRGGGGGGVREQRPPPPRHQDQIRLPRVCFRCPISFWTTYIGGVPSNKETMYFNLIYYYFLNSILAKSRERFCCMCFSFCTFNKVLSYLNICLHFGTDRLCFV